MIVREYLSVRRAFSLVRQTAQPARRVTFEELAILCHLSCAGEPLRTSSVAEYQGVLRPTMTHRASHLDKLGLIERKSIESDRRSVTCALSDEGAAMLEATIESMCSQIKAPMPLSRCKPMRMRRVVEAMGTVTLSSADLVVLCLTQHEDKPGLAICDLVSQLGLLQPTVSMAVASLEATGAVERPLGPSRNPLVALTEPGRARAEELRGRLANIHVRTPRIGSV